MGNAFDEMRRALVQARHVQSAADNHSEEMAKLIRGRLKHCDPWTLVALKKELRGFNMATRQWKD